MTRSAARFGTFAGVFTPNVLTILGIILFLRMGEVTGNAGLWHGLALVGLANLISLLTGFSLSAIATNMRIGAGGNYYVISRSLGLEVGGAIGIPLFLSQAISVAFYVIGFTEALQALPSFAEFDSRLIASGVVLVFVGVAYIGADFALKIQFAILAVLVVALASFIAGAVGAVGQLDAPLLTPNYQPGESFWTMFALFFPAVTGIEVGTSLSGDLKDPSRSIPRGTISSIVITAFIYLLIVVLFVFTVPVEGLLTDNLAMQRVALVPEAILAGVWASTLSSALGSVLAAPRTLQAIARDAVVPRWLTAQLGSPTEPRMAVLITGLIALGVTWAGDINAVAPVIAMFFLNTYGMVNLAAGIEALVSNPSYRPRFKVPWWVSMIGALGCYGAMFLISAPATLVAIFISYGVFFALQRRRLTRAWGDVRTGIWFALARFALLNLEASSDQIDAKNWRPNLIVFTGQPHNRQQLVEVADWLSLGQGIVTFFQLITQKHANQASPHLRETSRRHIRQFIEEHQMKAFAEAEIVHDFREGVLMVAQAHGIGNLDSNAILFGWSRTLEGRSAQMELLSELVELKKSVLFLNYDMERGFGQRRRINVWWQGRGGNEDLMLLLAHLIEQHPSWRNCEVYLLRVVNSAEAVPDTEAHMTTVVHSARVDAVPQIIVRDNPQQPLAEVIRQHSEDADLTILGMRLPTTEEATAYSERLNNLVCAVGSVLLVRNAQVEHDLLATE